MKSECLAEAINTAHRLAELDNLMTERKTLAETLREKVVGMTLDEVVQIVHPETPLETIPFWNENDIVVLRSPLMPEYGFLCHRRGGSERYESSNSYVVIWIPGDIASSGYDILCGCCSLYSRSMDKPNDMDDEEWKIIMGHRLEKRAEKIAGKHGIKIFFVRLPEKCPGLRGNSGQFMIVESDTWRSSMRERYATPMECLPFVHEGVGSAYS